MRGIQLIGRLDGALTIQYIEPKPLYENGRKVKGKQAINADGTPLWRITCLHTAAGERPEIVYVNAASEHEPNYEIGETLTKSTFKVVPYVRNGHVEYSLTFLDKGIDENNRK